MRSSSRIHQRGQSLVEAVVASAILGIGVVAGITAFDIESASVRTALNGARSQCLVRLEARYVAAAPFVDPLGPHHYRSLPGVEVTNARVSPIAHTELALVTIKWSGSSSASQSFYKSSALSAAPGDLIPPSATDCTG